ncbi:MULTISPECIES: hypothetical protein [unclassified Phenylobacterium]|uniref:hypothetical protein n=1 Tax=unclassified Phenylobacterium TaxID=2640670 RepID=UPI00083AF746|nr:MULTISPECIES: hypothetical protein [unclassified Phenylobacterium]
MRIRPALFAALLAAPVAAAAPAWAQDADAPVATASQASPPMSTAEQIDAFIKSSPLPDPRRDEALDGVVAGDDRKPHGEVGVAVGTGGYRSVYGRTDIPVGKNGRVSLAFQDTRNGYGYGGYGRGWYGGPYGGALGLGGLDRQRCDLESMSPARPLDATGGPNGRCVRPVPAW